MDYNFAALFPPEISVASGAQKFFEDFYRLSDTPDAHEEYSRMFANDARFILASRDSHGRSAILTTRENMWAAVATRKHTVHQIFPFGASALEYMLYGTVAYSMKNGDETQKDWAGRAVLKRADDGKLYFQFYQVYLDTGSTEKKSS